MKKRINISEESFDKYIEMAIEKNIAIKNQNALVSELIDNVLLDSYNKISNELEECKTKVDELKNEIASIDKTQIERINKLQAIGILDNDLSKAIEELLNNFVKAKEEEIKNLVVKI